MPVLQSTLIAALGLALAGAASAQPAAAPFDYRDSAAGDRWVKANNIDVTTVLGERWNLMGYTPDGVLLSGARLEHVVSDIGSVPHVVRRLERYNAATSQSGGATVSETREYDVNCRTQMIRQTAVTQYAGRNLGGAGVKQTLSGDWTPAQSDPTFAKSIENICAGAGRGDTPQPGRGGGGGRGGRGGRG